MIPVGGTLKPLITGFAIWLETPFRRCVLPSSSSFLLLCELALQVKKEFKSSPQNVGLFKVLKKDNLPQTQVSDGLDDVITHVLHFSVLVLHVAVGGRSEVLGV